VEFILGPESFPSESGYALGCGAGAFSIMVGGNSVDLTATKLIRGGEIAIWLQLHWGPAFGAQSCRPYKFSLVASLRSLS